MSPTASPLEGFWRMTRAEFEGESAPELVAAKTTLQLAAEHYAVCFDGEIIDEGVFTAKNPVEFPLLFFTGERGTNTGRTIPAIYQCVGDRLRICYGFGGQSPASFATAAGSQLYLASYRRVLR
ncbi:MAG: hypothetical protein ABIZ81_01525 [Opitutaceae bacterium]